MGAGGSLPSLLALLLASCLVSLLFLPSMSHWVALILYEARCFIEITYLVFFLACQVT